LKRLIEPLENPVWWRTLVTLYYSYRSRASPARGTVPPEQSLWVESTASHAAAALSKDYGGMIYRDLF